MRIIFMGTPDFAVPALQALLASEHDIIAVYTREPKPKGRGMKLQKSPVHLLANEHNIPVYTPKSLKKSKAAQAEFAALNADIAVVAAYGLILPQEVLDAPRHGCLNIHGSLLPRWRGASPIQHAIWKGDSETGITIMQMDAGMDTGDMLLKKTVPITQQTTSMSLFNDLSTLGGEAILETLSNLDRLTAEKQDEAQATYAPMLIKVDGEINQDASPQEIDRQIRALNPWPGTFVQGRKGRVKILSAHLDDSKLIYDMVQPEGKSKMGYQAAKNGGYL
jgi:methionyl-tRNA formyltransferase